MVEHRFPEVLVTDRAVFFDGEELPWHIAEDGISFEPGGRDDFNRLTVEFLTGTVTFNDPWASVHAERWHWMPRNIAFEFEKAIAEFDRIERKHVGR
ncbi:hypothetical protein [Mycobacterium phage PP]|uniref:Uncharacterized protein n=1 Tax=Mycobacterium phage PP TaxID=2077134 RepID=A0A2Z5XVF8_9CAUD|nr:hypothetical protein KIW36_gp53 [Mycobacterium phage PP]BBC53838.1 hypothetical protein [Mycobacterium phage PP]